MFGLGSGSCLVSFLCCNLVISGIDKYMRGGDSFAQSLFMFPLVWVRGYGLVHFLFSKGLISGIDYYTRREVFGSLRVYVLFYCKYYGTWCLQQYCP